MAGSEEVYHHHLLSCPTALSTVRMIRLPEPRGTSVAESGRQTDRPPSRAGLRGLGHCKLAGMEILKLTCATCIYPSILRQCDHQGTVIYSRRKSSIIRWSLSSFTCSKNCHGMQCARCYCRLLCFLVWLNLHPTKLTQHGVLALSV